MGNDSTAHSPRDGASHRLVAVDDEPADAALLSVDILRSTTGLVVSVDEDIVDLLGWTPDDLLGKPSTALIHPEDRNSAVTTWFEMIADPGTEYVWRGRYQAGNGTWRWVETQNCYDPDATGEGQIRTRMREVAGSEVSVEERLRDREQVLSRLADALPVGLFQVDNERRITFTNDRLHVIIGGTVVAATIDGLFTNVVGPDREVLADAMTAVMGNLPVTDFEIAIGPVSGDETGRVCSIALRTLTARTGEVTGAIGCVSDVTERVELRRHLEHRASTDSLTGCLNRAATMDALGCELATTSSGVVAVFIDLDGFKQVNDQIGHAGGDIVLEHVALRLKSVARGIDRVGRLGGDEFLVICPEVESSEDAEKLGRRFGDALAGDLQVEGRVVGVRGSAGVAWGTAGHSAETVVAEADRDMYRQKIARSDGPRSATA